MMWVNKSKVAWRYLPVFISDNGLPLVDTVLRKKPVSGWAPIEGWKAVAGIPPRGRGVPCQNHDCLSSGRRSPPEFKRIAMSFAENIVPQPIVDLYKTTKTCTRLTRSGENGKRRVNRCRHPISSEAAGDPVLPA